MKQRPELTDGRRPDFVWCSHRKGVCSENRRDVVMPEVKARPDAVWHVDLHGES